MDKLTQALKKNGYTQRQIHRAANSTTRNKEENIKTMTLPYIKGITDSIGKLLKRHDIKTTFNAHRKLSNIIRTLKQQILNENPGVYEIPCADCNRWYVGSTNRRITERRNEHIHSVMKGDDTSALAEHNAETGHTIDFQNSCHYTRYRTENTRKIGNFQKTQ
ncbi:MAG: hypothetical protein ACTS41_01595 [Candidatus Hodgkinia cicadicola]